MIVRDTLLDDFRIQAVLGEFTNAISAREESPLVVDTLRMNEEGAFYGCFFEVQITFTLGIGTMNFPPR